MHLHLFISFSYLNKQSQDTGAPDLSWSPGGLWREQAVLCFPVSVSTSVKGRQLAWVTCRVPFGWEALRFSALFIISCSLLGEKGHARKSIVFLKGLPTPTHIVLKWSKWSKASSMTPGMKKTKLMSKTSAVVHFGSLGVRRVWSNMWLHPNISHLRNS